ncbi:PREDICTED: nucleoporin GLE1-like isoform X1 [Acropora digitifera]|uniref:nucleoporin GLE1-like isoform X1 n=1 Tax=Acropora digitifera TaxID=70779 RepID=UPI00077A56ED|nr:PREDICTED: nucleoporin GLE1-like isoform X1 [Acropora digitifera]
MKEDRRRLEEQFRTDMETQRVLMQDMMTANMNELRSEMQATIELNQILLDTIEEQNKRIQEERKTQQQEMKLLQEKREEDRRRLEEQFRADMEAQRVLMQDMMTANMDELR